MPDTQKLFVSTLLGLIATGLCSIQDAAAKPVTSNETHRKLGGCFIQLDQNDKDRTDKYWDKIITDFQSKNLKTLIIQRAEFANGGQDNYQPQVSKILASVARNNANIDVYAGLYMPDSTAWAYGTPSSTALATDLVQWESSNVRLAKVIKADKNFSVVKGWYLPLEYWNFDTSSISDQSIGNLHDYIKNSVNDLQGLPCAMSVYANPWQDMGMVGPTPTQKLYTDKILKGTGLSVVLFQDSYGAKILGEPLASNRPPGVTPDQALKNGADLCKAFADACNGSNIKFWLVLEAFRARPEDLARGLADPNATPPFLPALKERFATQLAAMNSANYQLDNAVIFDYNHYIAPDKSAELNKQVGDWQQGN